MIAPHGFRAGGAEAHLLDLAESLARAGTTLWLIHRTPGHDPVPGVSARYVPRTEDPGRVIADIRPDVVHVHDDALMAGEAAGVVHAGSTVRSLHNWWFGCSTGTRLLRGGQPCPRAHGPGCLVHIVTASCTERPNPLPAMSRWRSLGPELREVRQAAAVIVYSEYARGVAIRNGVPADRCHVLRYYVDAVGGATPMPGVGRVCVVGRLTKLKGIDTLLRALPLSQHARILRIVGDGYYKTRLVVEAERLGISDRVEFTGWLDAESTLRAVQQSDVVAVPSKWPEPFGIVGLEAMSAGRAVVGARGGGISEWLADGVTGCLVESAEPAAWAKALDFTLGNPVRLARWGRAGVDHALGFSRERHLEELDTIYRTIPRKGRVRSGDP